jgi:OOP family OmpA-OmpF porin
MAARRYPSPPGPSPGENAPRASPSHAAPRLSRPKHGSSSWPPRGARKTPEASFLTSRGRLESLSVSPRRSGGPPVDDARRRQKRTMKNAALSLLTSVAIAATLGGLGCGPVAVDVAPVPVAAVPTPPVVAVPAGPPVKIVLAGGMNVDGAQLAGIPDIEFDTAKASIKATPQNEATLRLLLLGGQTNPNITLLRVEGHTDSDGDPQGNQVLSEQRAASVVEWLVAHGIDRARLRPVGCAARDPLFPNDTPEHKARNRRTEFDIEGFMGARPDGYTEACAPNSFRHPH